MSHINNEQLFQRAADLLDDLTSHPSGLDIQLEKAIESNDLDEIYRVVCICEGVLSQEHFIREMGDEY